MISFEEFKNKIDSDSYVTDYIVRIRRKYEHEPKFRETNEILLWSCEDSEYHWLNDWHEGEECVEIVGYIAVEDVYIW